MILTQLGQTLSPQGVKLPILKSVYTLRQNNPVLSQKPSPAHSQTESPAHAARHAPLQRRTVCFLEELTGRESQTEQRVHSEARDAKQS